MPELIAEGGSLSRQEVEASVNAASRVNGPERIEAHPLREEARLEESDFSGRAPQSQQRPVDGEYFNSLVEFSEDAIVGNNREGLVGSWNRAAEVMFGYTAAEMIGQSIDTIIFAEDRVEARRLRERVLAGERVERHDAIRRRKDGSRVRVSVSTSPILDVDKLIVGSAEFARDVTEQKLTDDRFRRVVESAPNAMLMVNRSGVIVMVNPQTEKTFGYSRDELVGQPLEILVPQRSRDSHGSYRETFFQHPIARPMGVGRELFGRRKDGSEFPVEIGLTPLHTDDGLYVMSVVVDISERVQAEKLRRVHLSELAHAARLSAVGEMFSELAHEINQPLGATANYIRASLRTMHAAGPAAFEQTKAWIEKAATQTTRTIEIVQRIGSFVKKGDDVRCPLDMNEVIGQIVSVPVFEIRGSGALQRNHPKLTLASQLPPVNADRVQIEQVLINLIRNAVESMADVEEAARQIVIETSCDQGRVVTRVKDTGCGMSEEQLSRLFTPFYTTKRSGMGIGLSISKSILESHCGTIGVESTLGEGTTFTFSLPALSP